MRRPTILMRRARQSIARMSLERPNGLPRSVGEGGRCRQKRSCEFQIQWSVWLVLTGERELADAGGPGQHLLSQAMDLLMTADGFRCPAALAKRIRNHPAGATNDRFN